MNDQEYFILCFGQEIGALAFQLTVDYTVQREQSHSIVSAYGSDSDRCRAIAEQAMQLNSYGIPLSTAVDTCISLYRGNHEAG